MEKDIVLALKRNRQTFGSMLDQLEPDVVVWRPSPHSWCLLEIVCHLYDEEIEDFRARVKHVLETPNEPLKSINPVGWVTHREYMKQNYNGMLIKFLEERQRSITWLESLESPAWTNTLENPELGVMSARKFLVNWLAHDYHHFRQINQLKYLHLCYASNEKLNYAGIW